MTDTEIIKMLECCKQEIDSNGVICGECKKCPNYEGETGLCKEDLPTVVLDLINRQKAENEQWQQVAFKHEETMQIIATEKQHYFDKLQFTKAKNEKLQEMLQDLYTAVPIENNKKYANELQKIKAEAYKEVIEKVKEIMRKYCGDITENDLDNLLKEMGCDVG